MSETIIVALIGFAGTTGDIAKTLDGHKYRFTGDNTNVQLY